MTRPRPLSPQQEAFVIAYVAGPDEMRGNGTRAYLHAYPEQTNERNAGSSASRLLKRDSIRARIREIRDEAEEDARARLRSWLAMAPKAQEVLDQAMRGELEGSDEQIRSAVKAAQEVLNRALGDIRQMHTVEGQGQTLNVYVAVAPPNDPHEKPTEIGGATLALLPSASG
jgi:hypothetical protein